MNKKNILMDELLLKAKSGTTNKSYESAETKEENPVKEKSEAGRKPVPVNQKKKARQVFYSDDDFAEIEACAELLCMEAKTFMQIAINEKVKQTLNKGTEC